MGRLVSIFFGLMVCTTPLQAQQEHGIGGFMMPTASVPDVWAEFETSCSRAISDPLNFVTTHPVKAADGLDLVVRSPDNQVVVLYNVTAEGAFRKIEMTGVPGALKITCQVHGSEIWSGDLSQAEGIGIRQEGEIRALFANRPGSVVVGGQVDSYSPFLNMPGASAPDRRLFGIQTELGGERRFIYAQIETGTISFAGLYEYGAEQVARNGEASDSPPPNDGAPKTEGAADVMRLAVDACLRNYRTPHEAIPALQAVGLVLSPGADKGSWEFRGDGVFGVAEAGDELYCTVQSDGVPLEMAKRIGSDLAFSLFPDMVQPGAPEGGNGPCDGLSIFAPNQMIWLRYAQAGNSGECIDDGTSAIIVN